MNQADRVVWARLSAVDYWLLRGGLHPSGSTVLGALRAMFVRITKGPDVDLTHYMKHATDEKTDRDKTLRQVVGDATTPGTLTLTGPFWNVDDDLLLPPPGDLREDAGVAHRFVRLSTAPLPPRSGLLHEATEAFSTQSITREVGDNRWLPSSNLEGYLRGDPFVTCRAAEPARQFPWVSVPLEVAGDHRGTARPGLLFESPRVHMLTGLASDAGGGGSASLVVGLRGVGELAAELTAGYRYLSYFAGDGRVASVEFLSEVPPHWDRLTVMPAELREAIANGLRERRTVRLYTPTRSVWGADGWHPEPLRKLVGNALQLNEGDVRLVAAAHGRYEVVGGWDLASGGVAPRASTAAVPPGATYVFGIESSGSIDDTRVEALVTAVHGRCHSLQQSQAGLGLTLLAAG